ncbi:HNH endonuclease signature motif containing protein [Mesorhizobium sp. M0701]|uniref:HNH endonuclease n=1 Tax=Mesorhizobium sp. M0701 TaxID=2956989 RepID=UPI00333BF839
MASWPYNTAAWQRLRAAKLSDQPLCEACLRREVVTLAHAVDHVVAIAKGGDAFPPLTGLMAMCEPCHNAKTNAVDHPNASGFRRALKGFDAEGNPLDPEGWTAPAARPALPVAHPHEPRGFAGRPIDRPRPASPKNKYLLSCEETKIWV